MEGREGGEERKKGREGVVTLSGVVEPNTLSEDSPE